MIRTHRPGGLTFRLDYGNPPPQPAGLLAVVRRHAREVLAIVSFVIAVGAASFWGSLALHNAAIRAFL